MQHTQIKQEILNYFYIQNIYVSEYKNNMIDRYINFVTSGNITNTFTEKHHILPKSIFPMYKDFTIHKWNLSNLPLRNHFIAHIMLHYIFGGKMTYALYHMLGQRYDYYKKCDNHLDELIISNTYKSKYYEEAKIQYLNERKGFGTWKDENNKNYFLHRDDPLIKELGLVWIMTGYKQTEEQIKYGVSRRNKGRGTKLKVYFMTYSKYIFKDEYDTYRYMGWSTYRSFEDIIDVNNHYENIKYNGGKATSEKYKGQKLYYDIDGLCYGYMFEDDEQIKQYSLITTKNSEKQKQQRKRRTESAKLSNTGTTVYNNGIIQLKFKDNAIIPDGFVKGGLPRNLVKGHTKKYDFTTKDNQDYIIKLLKEHNGSLEKIGKIIGMAGVNVKYNINKYMPNIDHTEYFTRLYKYQNDKAYKDEIDNLYEDPIDRIKYIDIDEYNNIIDIRNKIINSDINLKSNGWITKVTLLLGKNRKFVVRFMQTYMYDVDAYWR